MCISLMLSLSPARFLLQLFMPGTLLTLHLCVWHLATMILLLMSILINKKEEEMFNIISEYLVIVICILYLLKSSRDKLGWIIYLQFRVFNIIMLEVLLCDTDQCLTMPPVKSDMKNRSMKLCKGWRFQNITCATVFTSKSTFGSHAGTPGWKQ